MDNNQEILNEEVQAETVDPMTEPVSEPPVGQAVKAMVFGIISISLSATPFFNIVALVFAILARRWSFPIIENYPYTSARLFAKAGHITGTIGRILSIIFISFWAAYFLIIVIAMMGAIAMGGAV